MRRGPGYDRGDHVQDVRGRGMIGSIGAVVPRVAASALSADKLRAPMTSHPDETPSFPIMVK